MTRNLEYEIFKKEIESINVILFQVNVPGEAPFTVLIMEASTKDVYMEFFNELFRWDFWSQNTILEGNIVSEKIMFVIESWRYFGMVEKYGEFDESKIEHDLEPGKASHRYRCDIEKVIKKVFHGENQAE